MKKVVLSIVCLLALNVSAQKVIHYPFGAAQTFTAAASGTLAVTLSNQLAVMSAPTLTAAATLSVTAASSLKVGAMLFVMVKTTATEVTTFAGAIVSPTVAGVSGKTWSQGFMYNGTNFYPMGAKQQVD